MPGTNAGTGHPITFRCSECRKAYPHGVYSSHYGRMNRVKLTGRKRPAGSGRGYRKSDFSREYRCLDCGHTGWSTHIDLERLDR